MSFVCIRESHGIMEVFLKKIYENFVGTLETVRNIEVSIPRGSTVIYYNSHYSAALIFIDIVRRSKIDDITQLRLPFIRICILQDVPPHFSIYRSYCVHK